MKKGEKALFTIPPALACGKSRSPPTIPPKATLKFEVELLSWTGVRDICRDRGIVKKILTEGKGAWQNPEDLDEVLGAYPSEILVVYFIFPFGCDFEFAFFTVKYEARLEDGSLVSQSDATEFTVQDGTFIILSWFQSLNILLLCIQILSCTGTFFAGYFCIALSKAVKTMKKGEKALLIVKPQCMCCFYFVVCICFVFISLLMLSLSFFNLQMHLERKEVLNMVFHQMLCFKLISS